MNHITAVVCLHSDRNRQLLRGCLNSILNQTMPCEKVIIGDLNVPSDLIEWLRFYKDFEYLVHPFQHSSFQDKLRWFSPQCKTEYVAICDDDDAWYPNKLATQFHMAEYHYNNTIIGSHVLVMKDFAPWSISDMHIPSTWLINMNNVPNHVIDIGSEKDWDHQFFIRHNNITIQQPLTVYNVWNGSISVQNNIFTVDISRRIP